MSEGDLAAIVEWIEAQPEVAALAMRCHLEKWTPERFEAELRETAWHRETFALEEAWSGIRRDEIT